jgi:hypothetical protein
MLKELRDDVPSMEELMDSPLPCFITFAANSCGYSGTTKELIVNWVHPLFLKAKAETSKADNPNWWEGMKSPFADEFWKAAMKEIEASQFETVEVPIATIEKNMPYTLPLLKEKFKKHYTSSWSYAIERPGVIKDLLDKVRFYIHGQLAVLKRNLVGMNLFDDLKIIHRIPQGNDMAILSKYQVQLDTDLYRAMGALRDYRNNKAKLIEGEVIEDMAA